MDLNVQSSPFAALNQPQSPLTGYDDTQPPPETNLNNQSADRTARLAALLQTPETANAADLLTQIQSNTEANKALIAKYGDTNLRLQAASDQKVAQVKNFTAFMQAHDDSTDPDGSMRQGAAMASQAALQEDVQSKASYALEKAAVDRIQDLATRDPVQAQVLAHNLQDGDSNALIRDFNTKQLILQRAIENAGIAQQDQSVFSDFADFILGTAQSIMPFTRGDIGNVDLDAHAKSWYDSLLSGDRKQAEAGSLWSMPVQDFSDYVSKKLIPNIQSNSTFLGYHNQTQDLSTLTNLAHPGPKLADNAMDMVNNVGLISAFKPLRALTSIPSLLVRNGARMEAVGTVTDAMRSIALEGSAEAAKKSGVPMEEVVRAASPTALNSTGVATSTVPIAADVNSAFARGQELMATIPDLVQPGRFKTVEEFQDVLTKNIERINEQYAANATVKDVIPETKALSSNQKVTELTVTLGPKSGGLFGTQEEAEGFARSLRLPSATVEEVPYPRVEVDPETAQAGSDMAWEAIRDDSGQWAVKFKTPMRETGLYSNPLAPQATNSLSRYFLTAAKVSDEWLQSLAQVAGNTRQRVTASLGSKVKSINTLSQNELASLGQVLQAGNNEQRWLSDGELHSVYQKAFNRNPSVKEIAAYHDYKDLNDMEYALRNDHEYSLRHLRGMETVTLHHPLAAADRMNAVVDRVPSAVPKGRVYNAIDNVHFTTANPLTEERLTELRGKGAILIKFETPIELQDGTKVANIIASPRDLEIEALRRDQLGYRAGGHRIYSGKYFAKQARVLKQPDTVGEQLVNPNTYIVGDTSAEVQTWVAKMEQARLLVKGADNKAIQANVEERLNTIFQGSPGFPTAREFLDGLKNGTYSLKHSFETVNDRELPSIYHEANANLEFVDPDRTGTNGLLERQGRLYYSAKGERLRDFKGDLAPTLNPYKTLDQSLQNIAKLTSFADYKQAAVERWATTFRKYTSIPAESSDWKVFTNGNIGREVPPAIRQGALGQREVINRILGHQSEFDYQAKQYYRSVANWVGGSDPDNKVRQLLAKSVNWWSTKDPSASLRGLVFDAKMGFWNPVQVPIHLGNAYAAITLGGADKGMKSLVTAWHLRSFLTDAGTDQWLEHVTSTGSWKKMGFLSPDDMKAYMKYAKSSGMMNIGDANNMIDKFGPSAALSAFTNGADRTREAGRMLLHMTWRFNKMVASSLAWQEMREAAPGAVLNEQFWNKFAARTEQYDLNFSRESRAKWQTGWTSIPTQFFGYWTAIADAMLGKQFTPAQRMRLALGQLFLGGTAGMPVVAAADSFYTHETGDNAHPDTFWGGLRRGALDEIVYGLSGADVQIGGRMAVGDELTNIVQDLFGFGEGADKSLADIAGGASYSTLKSSYQAVKDIVRYSAMESGGYSGAAVTRDSLLRLGTQISTVNNITKAYMIFKYHELLSASGSVLAEDVPNGEGFAQLIGFRPKEGEYMANLISYARDNKELVTDAVKVLQAYRQRFATEPDNRNQIGDEINAFMQMLPEDVKQKALRQSQRYTPESVYKSLSTQIQKQQQEKALRQQLQDQQ